MHFTRSDNALGTAFQGKSDRQICCSKVHVSLTRQVWAGAIALSRKFLRDVADRENTGILRQAPVKRLQRIRKNCVTFRQGRSDRVITDRGTAELAAQGAMYLICPLEKAYRLEIDLWLSPNLFIPLMSRRTT
ncbi:MAG TPA: hypothetical protein V6C84_04355 [Coleofasciculaceae cyanobacterium]